VDTAIGCVHRLAGLLKDGTAAVHWAGVGTSNGQSGLIYLGDRELFPFMHILLLNACKRGDCSYFRLALIVSFLPQD